MKLLLDEDVDVRLRLRFSPEFQVETVMFRGWKGLKNGELLRAAEQEYDVLVTLDDNVPHQQSLSRFDLAVAILRPRSQRLTDLVALLPELERQIPLLRPGQLIRIAAPQADGPEDEHHRRRGAAEHGA